jgi:choline dehydrogenase-like flavoprotein
MAWPIPPAWSAIFHDPCGTSDVRQISAADRPVQGSAHVLFGHHENDQRLIDHSIEKVGEIMRAADGEDVWTSTGGASHGHVPDGQRPRASVVDGNGRSHDVPNLLICDGSVSPTSGAVNPSLTIQAIAARTADRIQAMAASGEL